MQRRGPLQVERSVIFGQHVLAVRFLPHLHIGDRIISSLEIGDLVGGIFRCAIEHRHRQHRGQPARVAASIEKIKSDLISLIVDVGWFVPRVHGRAIVRSLIRVGCVPDEIIELSLRRGCSQVDFSDDVAGAIAAIP